MPDKEPIFAETIFIKTGREILKKRLTPERLESIVSLLSDEERPRFHDLFSSLAESTKPEESTPFNISPELQAQLEQAEAIFGEDFMGPRQFEKAFAFLPDPDQLPAIPFSSARLEQAKQMGQMLVLHVDKDSGGKPMTMQNMDAMHRESGKHGRLCSDDWYQNEDFYTKDTPRLSWRLVSKDILHDSGSRHKNEIEHMEFIVETLQNIVFADMEMPAAYQQAIDEFEASKAEISRLMKSEGEWGQASEMIENLQLSKLTRPTPVEMIQFIEMYGENNFRNLFSNSSVPVPRRAKDGSLIGVGATSDRYGVNFVMLHPGEAYYIGVALSLQL